MSVGIRPTYYKADSVRLAEGDLYGRHISVALTNRVSGQVAYVSSCELVDLIRDDVSRTRALLS